MIAQHTVALLGKVSGGVPGLSIIALAALLGGLGYGLTKLTSRLRTLRQGRKQARSAASRESGEPAAGAGRAAVPVMPSAPVPSARLDTAPGREPAVQTRELTKRFRWRRGSERRLVHGSVAVLAEGAETSISVGQVRRCR